jgi:hypothetical protein
MEKLKNKYLELGELTDEQIKWINKEIPGTLDIDFEFYFYSTDFSKMESNNFVGVLGAYNKISFEEFKETYESYNVRIT